MSNSGYEWLPFFEEWLSVVCEKYDAASLYRVWREYFPKKYDDIGDIDPFSFIGKINSFGNEKCKYWCGRLKKTFNLKTPVPNEFCGKPKTNSTNPMFFNEYWQRFENGKETTEMDEILKPLWILAKSLNDEKLDMSAFETILKYKGVGLSKLTQLFFLCKPEVYYSYDYVNRNFYEYQTGTLLENSIKGFNEFQELAKAIEPQKHVFSYNAWLHKNCVNFDTLKRDINKNKNLNRSQKTNATSENENAKYITSVLQYIRRNKHRPLEKSFKQFLINKGVDENNIAQNSHYIDFVFEHKNKKYICELKPSQNDTEIKYAIRNALGQVLDYHFQDGEIYDYKVIVFQKLPKENNKKFLDFIKNNVGVYYLTEVKNGKFEGNLVL